MTISLCMQLNVPKIFLCHLEQWPFCDAQSSSNAYMSDVFRALSMMTKKQSIHIYVCLDFKISKDFVLSTMSRLV